MARNQILLNGDAREESRIAAETLTPGELTEPAATLGETQAASSAADAEAPRQWVREQRENEGAGVDTDIASGDECTILHPESGARINARIAHGVNVQEGAALESDGAGALQARTSGRTLAFAGTDINNTSGSTELHPVDVA